MFSIFATMAKCSPMQSVKTVSLNVGSLRGQQIFVEQIAQGGQFDRLVKSWEASENMQTSPLLATLSLIDGSFG